MLVEVELLVEVATLVEVDELVELAGAEVAAEVAGAGLVALDPPPPPPQAEVAANRLDRNIRFIIFIR